jgi:hypothetical protein
LGMRVRFVQPTELLIMPERTRNVPVLSSLSPTTHGNIKLQFAFS